MGTKADMVHMVEEFKNIYKMEWASAQKSLLSHKHEEEIIYLLMKLVRAGYEFCEEKILGDNQSLKQCDELMKEFDHTHLPKYIQRCHITNELTTFVNKCITCIYRILSADTQITIDWTPKGEIIDNIMYVIEGDLHITGSICDWTVWPALIGGDGKVLSKGVAIPMP